jgi:Na+-transporting NADH:ubiquinone oxidoreductase subunit NqrD
MATGLGTAFAQSSERIAHVNERIAVSKMMAAAQARAGAKWFYWIAGLSMINSLVVLRGGNLHFVVGLGITSLMDGLGKRVGEVGPVLDLVISGFVAGIFVLFGISAVKPRKWAFVTGMSLYAMDGLVLLAARDFLAVGFHGFALYAIYRGYAAAKLVQVSVV